MFAGSKTKSITIFANIDISLIDCEKLMFTQTKEAKSSDISYDSDMIKDIILVQFILC